MENPQKSPKSPKEILTLPFVKFVIKLFRDLLTFLVDSAAIIRF